MLISKGILRPVMTGAPVLAPGGNPGHVFIVLSGQISIKLQGENGEAVPDVLREGSIFGNFSSNVIHMDVRQAYADFPSILLEVPSELVDGVFTDFPGLHQGYLQRFGTRILQSALKSVPVLNTVLDRNLNTLAFKAKLSIHHQGDTIVAEGDLGDAFYVIQHGIASVRHMVGDAGINLAQLRAGDYFGEWSILTGAPRAATVTALTLMTVAEIDGELFLDFIQQNPRVRDSIDLVAQQRHDQVVKLIGRLETPAAIDERISEIHKMLV